MSGVATPQHAKVYRYVLSIPSQSTSPEHRKTAIPVVGMHRRGTFVLLRTLGAFGANLGRSLLAPDQRDNPTGYWENKMLVELHQEILESLHCEYLARLHDLQIAAGSPAYFTAVCPGSLSAEPQPTTCPPAIGCARI